MKNKKHSNNYIKILVISSNDNDAKYHVEMLLTAMDVKPRPISKEDIDFDEWSTQEPPIIGRGTIEHNNTKYNLKIKQNGFNYGRFANELYSLYDLNNSSIVLIFTGNYSYVPSTDNLILKCKWLGIKDLKYFIVLSPNLLSKKYFNNQIKKYGTYKLKDESINSYKDLLKHLLIYFENGPTLREAEGIDISEYNEWKHENCECQIQENIFISSIKDIFKWSMSFFYK